MQTQNNPFAVIPTVDAPGLADHLDACRAANVVAMIYGAPGVGKSTIVQRWSEANGYALYDIRLAQLLPEHLAAIQYPDANRKYVIRLVPAVVADVERLRKESGKPVCIFADELTLASSETLSAALEMLLDRRVNGFPLPPDTVIVAAGNRPQDTASAAVLDPPNRSRMASVVYSPAPADVAAYLSRAFPGNQLADAVGKFLCSQQAAPIVQRDEIGDEAAFYTPRGVEFALKMTGKIASGELPKIGSNKRAARAFESTLGRPFWSSLTAWAKLLHAVKPASEVLADVDAALKDAPSDQSTASAQLDALRDHVVSGGGMKEDVRNMLDYMSGIMPEHVTVWLQAQSTAIVDMFGASTRGQRFMEQLDVTGATAGGVAAKRRTR